MIKLTDAELALVFDALAESRYYEPNLDLVEEVRQMLLSKVKE